MKLEIKKMWVEALRSGKFKQGTKVLRSINDEFCCLGVLCELHRQNHPDKEWMPSGDNNFFKYMGNFGILPFEVTKWAELDDYEPKIMFNNKSELLYMLNDGNENANLEQLNFNQIADLIEKQY